MGRQFVDFAAHDRSAGQGGRLVVPKERSSRAAGF
jgi:hypothetical protein